MHILEIRRIINQFVYLPKKDTPLSFMSIISKLYIAVMSRYHNKAT